MANVPLAASIALGLFALPTLAQAADPAPIVLERSGNWLLRYDPESCKLGGAFGTGENQIIMQMVQFQPGDKFELSLYGKPMKGSAPLSYLEIGFGPGEDLAKRRTTNGTNGGLPMRVVGSTRLDNRVEEEPEGQLPPVSPEVEKAVTHLDVRLGRSKFYRLAIGPMSRTMQPLRKCTQDLVRSWGFDPEQQAARKRPPSPTNPPASWLESKDYPSDKLRRGAMGIVHFRLDVDETGAVTGCHIQQATKPEGFGDLSCTLILKRAHFEPALDKDGVSLKSYYVSTVKWIVPN